MNASTVSEAAAKIRALRRKHSEGDNVVAEVDTLLKALLQLQCQTADDAVALIDVSQQLALELFAKATREINHPDEWGESGSTLCLMVFALGRAIETLESLLKEYAVSQGQRLN